MEIYCTYNTTITGHEHLDDFGLINMNGRMYDPVMSAFLSPDNYMQSPNCQQGFNRYAYCMYNPLKYVDPTGEQYLGWDPGLAYRIEQEMRGIVLSFWHQCYDISMASHYSTIAMANCLFSHGQDTRGNGSGNHGAVGGSNNHNGPTGNSQEDGNQTNNSTNQNERPGSSPNNLASATNLMQQVYWWYMHGHRQDFYIDASTINFDYLSSKKLVYNEKNNTYSIDLFEEPYLSANPDLAMVVGAITLIPRGDNLYEIEHNTYDFDIRWEDGFSRRNIATALGGFFLYGNFDNYHIIPSPAMFTGGPFEIYFKNYVYIKP